ncbi:MAG: hypothetical protein KAJ19_21745 [Gammaproteobacteria bacterium]|nr:hypothetical protein [Gammaproteobacteria bacterium]
MPSMIRHNALEMEAWLHGIAKQIPFTTVAALNRTAWQTRAAEIEEILRAFDSPTLYTQRSVRFNKATVRQPRARIYINDNARGKGTSPSEYLARQVFGGARQYKMFERLLRKKEYVVPAPGTKRNKYGNISKATVKKVVSALDSGDTKKYFRRKGKGGTLSKAIFEKKGRGKKQTIKPIMFVVKRPRYRRRFKFFHVGMRTVERNFERNWQAMFNRIVISGGRVRVISPARITGFRHAAP